MPQEPEGRIIRFGSFEADLEEGRLTKSGVRIRLQEQPFQILALLLERPGQLVTREEIRQKLWSTDTFVEFDDALNTAVRKLRVALSDVADNPRFLETVPRRGYRFVAPVSLPTQPQISPSQIAVAERVNPAEWEIRAVEASLPLASRKSGWWRWALFAAGALVIAAAGGIVWYQRAARFRITSKDTIVLADFVEYYRRSGFRRCAPPGSGGRAGAVSGDPGYARPQGVGNHETDGAPARRTHVGP